MSGADLFIVGNGTGNGYDTGDYVTALQNVTSAPNATPIMEVSPDRGRMLKVFNEIRRGKSDGFPVYAKLYDTNGVHLPPASTLYWALKLRGMESPMKVSRKKGNISFYSANDITTQRDEDNIDGAKFVLQKPDQSGDSEPLESIKVRDIDSMYLMCDSMAQVKWEESEIHVDQDALDDARGR